MEIREKPEISAEEGDVIQKNTHSFVYKMGFLLFAFALMAAIMLLPSPDPLEK
ncbi:MAG: hypothetical protein JRD43_04115, partial [Deltaproteobacteria bacterium]|nr:hypothetical protein [Deltaproteobacteria bacterium]